MKSPTAACPQGGRHPCITRWIGPELEGHEPGRMAHRGILLTAGQAALALLTSGQAGLALRTPAGWLADEERILERRDLVQSGHDL